jgi:hypothetical protein
MFNKNFQMNKINLDIIKQFKDSFQYRRDFENKDIKNFLNHEILEESKGIKWLFFSNEQNYSLIGVEDEYVYALDSEGFLIEVCIGIENTPYELLRVLSESGNNGSVKDILQYNKEFELDLLKYENWCKSNNIQLDKNNIYHDGNGKLFDKYFELK